MALKWLDTAKTSHFAEWEEMHFLRHVFKTDLMESSPIVVSGLLDGEKSNPVLFKSLADHMIENKELTTMILKCLRDHKEKYETMTDEYYEELIRSIWSLCG